MNPGAPLVDLDEIQQFANFWSTITGVNRITLVGIHPDSGGTNARTFPLTDDDMLRWIRALQTGGWNVYFQPNECFPECCKKPSKSEMLAAHSRFADIDPAEGYPLAEERDRLHRLADRLVADDKFPPTCVIDSGNGVQILLATAREVLSPQIITRIEAETRDLESALGAGGTHDVTRLLRLPGTINYPNAKKREQGRPVSCARLLHSSDNFYTSAEAARMAQHFKAALQDSDLVRRKPATTTTTTDKDDRVATLSAALKGAGANQISKLDDLPADLIARFNATRKAWKNLDDRWAGLVDDLVEAGHDSSRSGADMSLASMLKAAGYTHIEAGLILCAFQHGKTNGIDWSDTQRLRHVARSVLRSHEPNAKTQGPSEPPPNEWPNDDTPPKQRRGTSRATAPGPQEQDEVEWPEPLDFLADGDMTGAPELRPEHLPDAIVPFVFDTAARMGVDPAAVALAALVSLASVMDDKWRIQPKQNDTTWTESPRIWGAIAGDPSMLKTPILKVATAPIDKMEAQARDRHEEDMRRYRCEMKAWKDAGSHPDDEPIQPRLDRWLVEGATTEAISEVLRHGYKATQRAPAGKVLIRQDEMSEWIAGFDRYRSGGKGGSDRGAYLRLYNGGRYTVDRIQRGTFAISNWSACILGGIQPGPIRQIAKDATDDGLLQRFCYCVPAHQGRGEDRRHDALGMSRYANLFPVLAALHPGSDEEGRRVVLHTEAHEHRLAVLELTEAVAAMPDAPDRLKSALGKWPGLWARMTLIFHLIDAADNRIRDGHVQPVPIVARDAAVRATAYLRDILLPHLLRADAVMFMTEQSGHAHWIAGFILSNGGGRITARDIMRSYRALKAPEKRREMLDVMASLEALGWVRPEFQPDGRPPVAWHVNPKVHTGFAARARDERTRRKAVKETIYEAVARYLKIGGER